MQASNTFLIHSSGTQSPNRSAIEQTKIVLPNPFVSGSLRRYSWNVGVKPKGYAAFRTTPSLLVTVSRSFRYTTFSSVSPPAAQSQPLKRFAVDLA